MRPVRPGSRRARPRPRRRGSGKTRRSAARCRTSHRPWPALPSADLGIAAAAVSGIDGRPVHHAGAVAWKAPDEAHVLRLLVRGDSLATVLDEAFCRRLLAGLG